MRYFFFSFVALSLVACGERGSSTQDKNSNNSLLGYWYDDGYGSASPLPGIDTGNGAVSAGPGTNTLQGSGPDGSLSAAETQALTEYVNHLSSEQRSLMQSLLLKYLSQCTFPPAGAPTVASCRSGNGQACAQSVAGYALGYLVSNAKNLNLSGPDMALLSSQASACAAVDLNNSQAVQTHVKAKSDSCKKGSRSSCLGLLAILGRLFLKALGMAFSLLQKYI